ncbi:MAG: HAD family hydrolase [Candidatus Tectomicrobia bacterium]|nr:HAD family hydrolase [Candidatus Tectomicrobia bacterium]
MSGRPAVFFDRDGTLNVDVGYVTHLGQLKLLPRAAAAVRQVNEAGWLAILATNQAGVARKYFPEWMIGKVHEKLQEELARGGARLDAVYYCPHLPDSDEPAYRKDCPMRKPYPGMLLKAAEEHGVDLSRSFMLGDKYSDLQAGWAAGCRSILLLTGYGRGERELRGKGWPRPPDWVAEDAHHAVEILLGNTAEGRG